ncbi:hypothetical protein C9J03_17125 [Photobacterium gaetbulicola]|uniref:hypothetical protein n=1 Tax=Photobacterium gaetbulicola TaxID=1295392 RepID=UPI0005CC832C|nr:hypothetical protein [Photobacterium gaetbulicola]PSU05902.1 hypothetical protein C9J03_17125 [Photobacterium gaetbulicola]
MLEYNGGVEVELDGEVAHLNAQGTQMTLTVPSAEMLSALFGLYRRLPVSQTLSYAPFISAGHRLVVRVPHGGSMVITRRQSWMRTWLPYQLSVTELGWWLRQGPRFLLQLWR